MFCSRCVLPILVLHLVLEQISAAVLPNSVKTKREVDWLDQELFPHLSDPSEVGDLFVGDAGDINRHRSVSWFQTAIFPTEHVLNQNQNQNQNLHKQNAHEKRWKVAPMDSISRFQIPTFRKRKDKTKVYSEE